MFSAPKLRWLLDHLPAGVVIDDVRVGTVDSWLIWRLTGGNLHRTEAGTPPAPCCTTSRSSTGHRSSSRCSASRDRAPRGLAVGGRLRCVHRDCRSAGRHADRRRAGRLPCCVVRPRLHPTGDGQGDLRHRVLGDDAGGRPAGRRLRRADHLGLADRRTPTYALEGNILYSGADWRGQPSQLTSGDVAALISLATEAEDSGGVSSSRLRRTRCPVLGPGGARADLRPDPEHGPGSAGARCGGCGRAPDLRHRRRDRGDPGRLRTFRADGGATAADLLMRTQADLLDRPSRSPRSPRCLPSARLGWAGTSSVEVGMAPVHRPALAAEAQ